MDPYLQFQLDVAGRLASDSFFATLPILREDEGLTPSDVDQALLSAGSFVKGGKAGAGVIVFQTEEAVQDPNVPGPREQLELRIRCLEVPKINRSAAGSGLRATALARRVKSLLHLWFRGGVNVEVVTTTRYYHPGDEKMPHATLGKDVLVRTLLPGDGITRAAAVSITGDATALTLTSATPGAAIWYTLDGTFPGPTPANGTLAQPGTAQLYSAPFAVPSGTCVRAAAYAEGLDASDLKGKVIA